MIKGEHRLPVSMMFIHDIDNNILNSGVRFLRVYQDEYEMWEIYQEINMFWVGSKPKKTDKTVVNDNNAIINI